MKPAPALFVSLIISGTAVFSSQADDIHLDEAGDLFTSRCAMCHQLPDPGMLKPTQWELILGTMQQRMRQADVPPLNTMQSEMILEYLTVHARQ